jgi:hypothetical protein
MVFRLTWPDYIHAFRTCQWEITIFCVENEKDFEEKPTYEDERHEYERSEEASFRLTKRGDDIIGTFGEQLR